MRTWRSSRRFNWLLYCQLRCFSRCQHVLQQQVSIPTNEKLLQTLRKLKEGDSFGNAASTISRNIPKDVAYPAISPSTAQLSQSPLTDPKLNTARFGHKKPKPLPRKQDLSPFQLKLRKNPYDQAHALATSPRYCLLTGARIPSYFLLRFGLTSHPETGEKWHLPTLAGDASLTEEAGVEVDEEKAPHVRGGKTAESRVQLDETNGRKMGLRTLSGTNFLSSHKALTFISHLHPARYRNLLPFCWKQESLIKNKDLIWREDMAEFVLELMRKKAVQDILHLTYRTSAMYIVSCNSWDDVRLKPQVGAVLWLRMPKAEDGAEKESGREEIKQRQDGPPLYAMVEYHGSQIPVYNLKTLLGEQHLSRLIDERPKTLDSGLAAVKAKNLTVNLQQWLWKMMGYLAQ